MTEDAIYALLVEASREAAAVTVTFREEFYRDPLTGTPALDAQVPGVFVFRGPRNTTLRVHPMDLEEARYES